MRIQRERGVPRAEELRVRGDRPVTNPGGSDGIRARERGMIAEGPRGSVPEPVLNAAERIPIADVRPAKSVETQRGPESAGGFDELHLPGGDRKPGHRGADAHQP
jgi:hypothetical protein